MEINASMTRTRQQLLESFDDEVREKLKVRDETSRDFLSHYERLLMQLTRYELDGYADFRGDVGFHLSRQPSPDRARDIPLGNYELPRRSGEAHLYRLNHPLAQLLIARARNRDLPPAQVCFDYGQHNGKITLLEPLIGTSGWLTLSQFSVESLDQAEDHLILAAVTDGGERLDEEVAARLMTVPGTSAPLPPSEDPGPTADVLAAFTQQRQNAIQREISQRNARFFEAETEKLDGWADDLKSGLEREIKEIDRQIKEARRAATVALTLEEKLAGQKQVKALEAQRNQKRRSLFDAQDQVDQQREDLITTIEGKLTQEAATQELFSIRWELRCVCC